MNPRKFVIAAVALVALIAVAKYMSAITMLDGSSLVCTEWGPWKPGNILMEAIGEGVPPQADGKGNIRRCIQQQWVGGRPIPQTIQHFNPEQQLTPEQQEQEQKNIDIFMGLGDPSAPAQGSQYGQLRPPQPHGLSQSQMQQYNLDQINKMNQMSTEQKTAFDNWLRKNGQKPETMTPQQKAAYLMGFMNSPEQQEQANWQDIVKVFGTK